MTNETPLNWQCSLGSQDCEGELLQCEYCNQHVCEEHLMAVSEKADGRQHRICMACWDDNDGLADADQSALKAESLLRRAASYVIASSLESEWLDPLQAILGRLQAVKGYGAL